VRIYPALALGVIFFLSVSAAGGAVILEKNVELRPMPLGPFVRTGDGRLFTVDMENHALWSADGGKTWTTEAIVDGEKFAIREERAIVRTRRGVILIATMNAKESFFGWNKETFDAPGARRPTYVIRSPDDGRTWEAPRMLHEDYTGAIRDMIETTDGTVVFTSMKMRHNPGRHTVMTYRTTDDGKTWQASNVIDRGGVGHHGGVTEATIVQRRDGTLWMLIRTNWKVFWQATSRDGGLTWTDVGPTTIGASSAPGLVKRLASGRLILLWNRYFPEGQTSYPETGGDNQWSEVPVSNHRVELSAAFSEDDGRTWSTPRVLARVDKNWLAYPYLFEATAGELWITTMQGGMRAVIREADFARQ
jgi:sialidase-1